jgi:hypothetical protein
MTAALGWEAFEYFSFVTHSRELPTAYGDTLGDLVMGWFGSIAAGLLIHFFWRSHMTMPGPGSNPTAMPVPSSWPGERRGQLGWGPKDLS